MVGLLYYYKVKEFGIILVGNSDRNLMQFSVLDRNLIQLSDLDRNSIQLSVSIRNLI